MLDRYPPLPQTNTVSRSSNKKKVSFSFLPLFTLFFKLLISTLSAPIPKFDLHPTSSPHLYQQPAAKSKFVVN
jgi:hypothetical protein